MTFTTVYKHLFDWMGVDAKVLKINIMVITWVRNEKYFMTCFDVKVTTLAVAKQYLERLTSWSPSPRNVIF